jgi:hypothetical protein
MEIVGLKNFVQDDINTLIFKFVGFQSKVAKVFEEGRTETGQAVQAQRERFRNSVYVTSPVFLPPLFTDEEIKENAHKWILQRTRERRNHYIYSELDRLVKIRSITQRKAEFLKLRVWVRKFLLIVHHYFLLPRNASNLKFINNQAHEVGLKGTMATWCSDGFQW